ncbi:MULTISPECIES: CHAT domain-containing protein, partial [Spirulina sp. CCY15215]|uniref:CHAT domain-containing protein n=1 Tax=Spirulina sp. CCY15215 TaxID=2767591 RepID=UPI00194F131B
AAVNPIQPDDATLIRTGDGTQHSPTVMRFGEVGESWDYTFIDDRADNPYQLLYGGKAGTVSRLVLRNEDGIAKIGEVLDFAKKPIETLTIVAEGNAGELWLGKDFITAQNFHQYRTEMESWGESLSPTADILLYSCFTALGAAGESLVAQIANATGADVAASIDATGSANYGGNWVLEYSTGNIAAIAPFTDEILTHWDGKLATITVNSLLDNITVDSFTTLREALASANPNDTIAFNVTGTITIDNVTFGNTGFDINDEGLIVDGSGQNSLFLNGGGNSRVFNISANNATIKNLTIQNGNSAGIGNGGGINHTGTGTLTLTNTTVSVNTSGFHGGGIHSSGALMLTNSTVSGNSAPQIGGGIYGAGASPLTLTNSTVSDNLSSAQGGGIHSVLGSTLTLTNSTVSGNSSNIQGGGINSLGTLTLTNSTISGNSSGSFGGGIHSVAGGTITNSTIAYNTAATNGGGIYRQNGTLDITNTIIAKNIANGTGNDLAGDFTGSTFNFNLIGNTSGATNLTLGGGNITGVDPQLLPLANNGGATQTHALNSTSPAINRGRNNGAPPTDQRGFFRDSFTDIGAFELLPEPSVIGESLTVIGEDVTPTPNAEQSPDFSLLQEFEISLADRPQGLTSQPINTSSILQTVRTNLQNALASEDMNEAVSWVEVVFCEDFSGKECSSKNEEKDIVENIRATLKNITRDTGTRPAIVYAVSFPEQLELVLVTPEDQIVRKVVPEASAIPLQQTVANLRQNIVNTRRPTAYLASSRQLYNWLIAPLASELENVDTLIFSLDAGLRGVPLAALHDGEQFLVEKYSLGVIPSISLTNSRYASLHNARVLAMGASEFSEYDPLPAVPVELALITKQLAEGTAILNQGFTFDNLKTNARSRNHQILHLATHADFQAGDKDNAHIQLWNDKLAFDRLRELGLTQENPIELLVLSACRTALGDLDAELGFAGLAVNTGAKSALASLWYVSDGATLNLMGEFYRHLYNPDVTIKAEALRRAQIAMIRGESLAGDFWENIARSPELGNANQLLLEGFRDRDFSHPYYWSAFTLVGSPW